MLKFFIVTLLSLLVYFTHIPAIAQKENYHWIFGNGAELDFNKTPPNIIPNNSLKHQDVTISMSDNNGNLLFYSSFDTIWTHNHTVMENATNLFSPLFAHAIRMSMISIKSPKSKSTYYNFYNTTNNDASIPAKLLFVTIDMKENGGLGKLIDKKVLPFELNGEHLGMALHSSNNDYWLLTIGMDNKLHARLINNMGVSSISVISELGANFPTPLSSTNGIFGHIIFSHNMKYLVISSFPYGSPYLYKNNNLFFYSFDKASGKAKYLWSLKTKSKWVAGIEFSPNDNYMYISYALSKGSTEQIKLNKDRSILPTHIVEISSDIGGALSLTPDGKIYIAKCSNIKKLSVINKPNLEGNLCDFQSDVIDLHEKNACYTFPRFVKRLSYVFSHKKTCQTVEFTCSSCISQEWNFGDGTKSTQPNPTHTYSQAGTYTVSLTATYTNGTTASTKKNITINPRPKAPVIIHK